MARSAGRQGSAWPASPVALLAAYDSEVQEAIREAIESDGGTRLVQELHRLRHLLAVHDSMLGSVLCPVLDHLPGGPPVAGELRQGCHERAELLTRFQRLTEGVAARNVYPACGQEIEAIVEGVAGSFQRHELDEIAQVSRLLQSPSAGFDPQALATRMASAVDHAPGRMHRADVTGRPAWRPWKRFEHSRDNFHDWMDSHHGWPR